MFLLPYYLYVPYLLNQQYLLAVSLATGCLAPTVEENGENHLNPMLDLHAIYDTQPNRNNFL